MFSTSVVFVVTELSFTHVVDKAVEEVISETSLVLRLSGVHTAACFMRVGHSQYFCL